MKPKYNYLLDDNLTLEEKGLIATILNKAFDSKNILEDFLQVKDMFFGLEKKGYVKIDKKHSDDDLLTIDLDKICDGIFILCSLKGENENGNN